jgi:hypothetical protein
MLEAVHTRGTGNEDRDLLKFEGVGKLGEQSDGIDPLIEDVTLRIGALSLKIDGGLFVARVRQDEQNGGSSQELGKHHRAYSFRGILDGLPVTAELGVGANNNFVFRLSAWNANAGDVANPIDVTLSIGGDVGSSSIRTSIGKH